MVLMPGSREVKHPHSRRRGLAFKPAKLVFYDGTSTRISKWTFSVVDTVLLFGNMSMWLVCKKS